MSTKKHVIAGPAPIPAERQPILQALVSAGRVNHYLLGLELHLCPHLKAVCLHRLKTRLTIPSFWPKHNDVTREVCDVTQSEGHHDLPPSFVCFCLFHDSELMATRAAGPSKLAACFSRYRLIKLLQPFETWLFQPKKKGSNTIYKLECSGVFHVRIPQRKFRVVHSFACEARGFGLSSTAKLWCCCGQRRSRCVARRRRGWSASEGRWV